MEEVSRLACSPIRKGITFTHFLRLRKLKPDENVSGSANFLTNPCVIEVPGKEAFLCPCVKFTWRGGRFAHGEYENNQSLITNMIRESSEM